MNQSFFRSTLTITLFAPLARYLIVIPATVAMLVMAAIPGRAAAHQHHHYKLIEVATFGGPNFITNFIGLQNSLLSKSGRLVGGADTPVVDPFCFDGQDCFVEHAFDFHDGVLTDLGALPGGANSQAFWISSQGLIVGMAQNGEVDPLLGIQSLHAVAWKDGRIIELGSLGGNESLSQAVNERGQIVGIALNAIPDPISLIGPVGTQMRAFLWENGVMQDLGTLGGPDAWANYINDRGQVAGGSFANSVINPATGRPTTHPFLWEHGEMMDLGTVGGSFANPEGINNQGEVVGEVTLPGDPGCNGSPDNCEFRAFVWERDSLKDIGTLGGSQASALGVNDSGEVVGYAYNENDQALLAFVWKKGVMTSLGASRGSDCSIARAINSRGQIVGPSFPCVGAGSENATLWEKGSAIDLNTFVPPGVDLHLTGDDIYINDRGDIAGTAVRSNGDVRAFLLIPCDENHPNIEGCDYSPMEVSTVAASHAAETAAHRKLTPQEISRIRALMMNRHRGFMPRLLGSVRQRITQIGAKARPSGAS
jgi:probable HAF family extracellular repeat protein